MSDSAGDQVTVKKCEMINPHHPDCECVICMAHHDDECDQPAIALVLDGNTMVCQKHAVIMECEGWTVVKFV